MAQMSSEVVLDACVTRLRQIAPIATAWGPGNAYTAIKIVQEGDLGYLPENPSLVSDLPAVFVKIEGDVDVEVLGMTPPEFEHTYRVRVLYLDTYARATDTPSTIKRTRCDVLADGFMDSASLNSISVSPLSLLYAVTVSTQYDTPEEVLVNALGIEDVLASAFTVEVTGISTGS